MKRIVIHKQIYRRGPFGGTLNTTLCGRMLLSSDGMNSGDAGVTCKFCLKKLGAQQRRKATQFPAEFCSRSGS